MSMLSWYVIVAKALQQARMRKLSAAAGDSFWHTKSFADGLEALGPERQESIPPPRRAGFRSCRAPRAEQGRPARRAERQRLDRELHAALDRRHDRQPAKRTVDPRLDRQHRAVRGPVRTVGGSITRSLHRRGGQASIEKVAGPSGEALIMTALGLAVAVPAVLGYNALIRGNKVILAQSQQLRP
jgi:biopolymer transport protein ExbB